MKTRNDLRARIKDVIRPNGIGAITAEAHQELLLELVDILGAEIDEVEAVTDVVSDGNYPAMTVGYADNLVGRGEATPEMFSFRASGGRSINDGTARIKTLRGNAVVLNQMISNNRNADSVSGVSFTKKGNTWECNGTATADAWFLCNEAIKVVKGHKYYYGGCPLNGSKETFCLWEGSGHILDTGSGTIATLNVDTITPFIVIRGGYNATGLVFKPIFIDLTKMFGAGNEPTSVEEFNARMPLGVDMTAYNEGEVIPFNATAIKAIGDNAWDEEWENGGIDIANGNPYDTTALFRNKGYIRVIPNTQYYFKKPIGVVTYLLFYDEDKNFVKWLDPFTTSGEGGVFTTYNAPYMRFTCYMPTYNRDIIISLYHSGWKAENAKYQPYKEFIRNIDTRILEMFPNGMMPWDKVYNKNGKGYIVKGTGSVDLGDLRWYNGQGGYGQVLMTSSSLKEVIAYSQDVSLICGAICKAYVTRSAVDTYNGIEGISINNLGEIKLYDSRYTDVASFKAAMQGVMLYYELAEPQVYEFAEPFNLDYEVADFGTEEILCDTPSAPLSADIIYQFNAVDSIRDLLTRVASLEAKL